MKPNPLFRRPPLSAYAIAAEGDEATLNLYGEIVDTPPVDWFTGEPVTDGYIALSDFLPSSTSWRTSAASPSISTPSAAI